MSEELELETEEIEYVEDIQEEAVEEEVEEVNEELEEAKKYGYLSKEEWEAQGKPAHKYKSPEEFNKTAKVIDQIYTLKKKVEQRDRELQAVIDYQQRTAQREYERAKQELQNNLANSKDDMDVEAVSHYTKELTRLEDMENSSHTQQRQQAQQSAQQSFIERNEHWFNDRNPDLKARAIEIDNELKDIFPNASYEDLAKKIENRMQYEHPERVLAGSRQSKGPGMSHTQSSINKTAVVRKDVFRNLSQEHRDTYQVYKRINPKITEADFIQRLKADGEL